MKQNTILSRDGRLSPLNLMSSAVGSVLHAADLCFPQAFFLNSATDHAATSRGLSLREPTGRHPVNTDSRLCVLSSMEESGSSCAMLELLPALMLTDA